MIDLIKATRTYTDTVASIAWWLLSENKFKFACAATELWARDVSHCSANSIVARALQEAHEGTCTVIEGDRSDLDLVVLVEQ